MTKKRFLGVVIAVLLAAAVWLGVWWLIARPAASDPALNPQGSHDPYDGLSETAIPYAMRQSTPFSRGNPPAIPADYPAIQLKQRELSLSDFALEEMGEEYTVSIEGNTLIIRRSDWEEQSTAPLEVSREQQYTKVLQDLTRWKILDPDEDFSVSANESDGIQIASEDESQVTNYYTERAFVFLPCYKGREIINLQCYGIGTYYDAYGLKYLEYHAYTVEETASSQKLEPMVDEIMWEFGAEEDSYAYYTASFVYVLDLDGVTHRAKAYYHGTELINLGFADAETGEYISSVRSKYTTPGPTDTHLSSTSTTAAWPAVTASQE